jgi:hypothetical protein
MKNKKERVIDGSIPTVADQKKRSAIPCHYILWCFILSRKK